MKTEITFIADTHHFSPTLTDCGRSFQLRSGSDQKCLIETGPIIDAAFDFISKSSTRAVMIAGDVTDDGEKVSHEEFREKIRKLSETKPVYLITATHDWCCDRNPRAYFGKEVSKDVPYLDHNELRDFYYDFGPKQAISEYITHLGLPSYVVDLCDEVRLLAINDDQDGEGHSGYSEEHLQWIEAQIKKANEEGKVIIGMEHHLIMPHAHPLISAFGMTIGNREIRASRLADAGLKYMFVGHSHIQRVSEFVSEKGNKIIQVNIGSLVGYPSSIVNVTVEDGKVSIDTVRVPTFEYKGTRDTEAYLKRHVCNFIDNVVISAAGKDKKEYLDRMQAMGVKPELAGKLRPVLRPVTKKLLKMKAGTAYKIVNALTLGRALDKKDVEEYKNKPVMDFVHEMILNTVGGTPEPKSADSAYCRLVKGVVSVPHLLVPGNKTLAQLPDVAQSIITGGKFNNYHCELK